MKLYAAKLSGEPYLPTVRLTNREAWNALIVYKTWTNCFDMRFEPTRKELKVDGWTVAQYELKEAP
jgi:hypothetical protein